MTDMGKLNDAFRDLYAEKREIMRGPCPEPNPEAVSQYFESKVQEMMDSIVLSYGGHTDAQIRRVISALRNNPHHIPAARTAYLQALLDVENALIGGENDV